MIRCSGWVRESFPANNVSVAISCRSNHRLTGLRRESCLKKDLGKTGEEEKGRDKGNKVSDETNNNISRTLMLL